MISPLRYSAFGATIALTSLLIFAQGATARSVNALYSFCSITKCRDGVNPDGIASDSSGNLFGVTQRGGNAAHHGGYGTIYELKKGKTFTLLYRFCGGGGGCSDGIRPIGPLVVDISGNLYGVTLQGGAKSGGTIFELSRSGDSWQFHKLYDFCSQAQCADGYNPFSGLTYAGAASGSLYDGVSPLFGVTTGGGNGNGVAYQLAPNGEDAWTETVLYTFCTQGGSNCTDGSAPGGGLLVDANGNLFGTTTAGGANHPAGLTDGAGVVFKLASTGNSWTESVLYDFCGQSNCSDGADPFSAVIQDASGAILGTTTTGGNACSFPNGGTGCGIVYRLTSDESGWHEAVLHSFCSESDCGDGAISDASLLIDASGNLFGTATYGGGNDSDYQFGSGVLFEISGATFKVLHSFCALNGCSDGSFPNSAVIMKGSSKLVGVTTDGGPIGAGVVFDLKPKP